VNVRTVVMFALLVAVVAPARAEELRTGPRVWAGGGIALDPTFAAVTAGADWFVRPSFGVGISGATTVGAAADHLTVETAYGHVGALARARAALCARLRLEGALGFAVGRTRFRSPGEHTEVAPAAVVGVAMGVALPARLELAVEATTHVDFTERTGTRNRVHTDDTFALVLRWGL
jgi:hypothetical protein